MNPLNGKDHGNEIDEVFELELCSGSQLIDDSISQLQNCAGSSLSCPCGDCQGLCTLAGSGTCPKDGSSEKVSSSGGNCDVEKLLSERRKYQEESKLMQKHLITLQKRMDAEVKKMKIMEQKLCVSGSTIARQRKEIILLQRQLHPTSTGATERRLETALREVNSLRAKLDEMSSKANKSSEDIVFNLQSKIDKIYAEKNDLVNCLRKQSRLMDVLKRQKLHLEATVLVDLMEKDIEKYFDLLR